jgi:hypothetical protein
VVFAEQLVAATSQIGEWFPCRIRVPHPLDQIFEVSHRGAFVVDDGLNLVLDGSASRTQRWWRWVFTGPVDFGRLESGDIENRMQTPMGRDIQHESILAHLFQQLKWPCVWVLVSQTWRDRLVGAAVGAILTIAGLWFALVAGATVSYIFRG